MVHVTFGITMQTCRIFPAGMEKNRGLFDAFKWPATVRCGSVRLGLAEHVCTGGIQNKTQNMTTDGQHCLLLYRCFFSLPLIEISFEV